MRVTRSMVVDLDNDRDLARLKRMGRTVWQEMQSRVPVVDKRNAPEIIRDLRARYGNSAAIAEALGETRGTKGYNAALRQIQRHLKGERGIGKAYRERYRQIAPPSTRERFRFFTPQRGHLRFVYLGKVIITSKKTGDVDDRTREIVAPDRIGWKDPGQWQEQLRDPLKTFQETWRGPEDFLGVGRFTILFDGD